MHKGQIASMDLLLAVLLFTILSTIFFVLFNTYQSRLSDALPRTELELYTLQFSNQLIKSPGIPDNWELNINQTKAIGLADRDRIISEDKLGTFKDMNYSQILSISNIGSYNFYFVLLKENKTIAEIGNYPAGESVKTRNYVIYKNETATVEVSLWK